MHQSNVPELRFESYNSDWENIKINEIISINPKQNLDNPKNENIKSVNLEHLDQGTGILLGYDNSSNDGRVFKKGQVLFGRLRPYLKKYWLCAFSGICSGEIWVLDGKKVDNRFLIYMLQTEYFNHLASISSGTKMPRADWNYIKSKKFYFPDRKEQNQIASFLSTVDSKIEKLTKKKELLEEYKKGVMQKLFSGEMRFKDENGNNYPDWERKTLKELSLSYYQGINTAADKIEYHKDGFPILQAKHITDEYIDFNDVRYVDKTTFLHYKNKYNPKINDILISNIGTIGKIVLIEQSSNFLIAWNIFKLEIETLKTSPIFLSFSLKTIANEGYFDKLKTGNATKFVNKSDIVNTSINLPSKKEQEKIASFLNAVHSKIGNVSLQIEKTKEFKKGLLQQMFV